MLLITLFKIKEKSNLSLTFKQLAKQGCAIDFVIASFHCTLMELLLGPKQMQYLNSLPCLWLSSVGACARLKVLHEFIVWLRVQVQKQI